MSVKKANLEKLRTRQCRINSRKKIRPVVCFRERGLRKINKKVPKFISLTPHENVVAEYSFIVVERKKERERETKENEEFSSPMLKYEMDEKAVRQQVTERGKREKKRKFLPPELNNQAYKVVKSDEERKKEKGSYLLKV